MKNFKLNREDVLFTFIDIQDKLLKAMYNSKDIVKNGNVLANVAKIIEAESLFTVQYPKGLGYTNEEVKAPLKDKKEFDKLTFNSLDDEKIKKEIENFKFFSQYGNFKDLKDYKDGEVSYNPNAPNYSAKYQLSNNDYNVKQIRKRYDIPTEQAPKLLLKGTGDLKGSSTGSKNIEFTFVEKKGENIYFTDSVEYTPSG